MSTGLSPVLLLSLFEENKLKMSPMQSPRQPRSEQHLLPVPLVLRSPLSEHARAEAP